VTFATCLLLRLPCREVTSRGYLVKLVKYGGTNDSKGSGAGDS